MIAQQDFRFKDTIRLWRLPSQRLRQGLDEVTLKKYDTAHYHAVCGRIVDVNFADNGVPYVGGARYHIDWEDGYTEPAVPASDLLALYTQTPASLGTGSVLDVGLREMLVGLGEALGLLIEGEAEGPETRLCTSFCAHHPHIISLPHRPTNPGHPQPPSETPLRPFPRRTRVV